MINNKKKFIISGWYGFKNIGDESILLAIIQSLQKTYPGCQISAFSYDPKYTKKNQAIDAYYNFVYFSPKNIFKNLFLGNYFKIPFILKKTDCFILGGGGFVSDWQSSLVIVQWLGQLMLAKLFGCQTMLYAVGAGPIIRPLGKRLSAFFLNHFADKITVRDEVSRDWLIKAGVKKEVIVTADPVLNLDIPDHKKIYNKEIKKIGLIFAPFFKDEKRSKKLKDDYLKIMNFLIENKKDITLIPFQVEKEKQMIDFFKDNIKDFHKKINLLESDNLNEVIEAVQKQDINISLRLHGSILSFISSIPCITIIYHHKSQQFLKRINALKYSLEIGDGINWKNVNLDFDKFKKNYFYLENNYNKIIKDIKINLKSLKDAEKNNIINLKTINHD